MKATRNFVRLTLKAETAQDLKALDTIAEQLEKAGNLSEPIIDKQVKQATKPEGKKK